MPPHDLSVGGTAGPGDPLRGAGAGRVPLPPRHLGVPAERLGERDLPDRRPRERAFGAAGAPPRVPLARRDRLGAGLDGRAAGGGGRAHAPGAARPGRPPDRHRGRRGQRRGTQLRAVRVPARDRAGRGLGAALRGAWRDHRQDAPAREAVAATAGLLAVHLGLRHRVRHAATVGAVAGRHRGRPRRTGGTRPASTRPCGPGWPRSAPAPRGTGWSTPTPGWPTCWSTATR